MQPQAAQRRPPRVVPGKPTKTLQRGDLVCGTCGEGNAPSRKFCSRCGESLVSATVVRIPWWKRILPRRRPKELRAGERPWEEQGSKAKRPPKRGFAKVVRLVRRAIAVGLLVGGLLYGLYAPFRDKVDDTYTSAKDRVMAFIHPKFDPVTAGPGTTSNVDPPVDPLHPALMAVDGFKNTYWVAPTPTDALQPTLDVALTEPATLARIIVRNGAFDDFQAFDRPKTMLFVYDNGNEDTVTLQNTPDPQTIELDHADGVTRFKIVVTDVYRSIDGSAMALTEVELFTQR